MSLNEASQMAQALQEIRGENSETVPLQAPIGGWNTRDAYDDIPPEDALIMENWIPGLGQVSVREGCSLYSRLYDGEGHEMYDLESLMPYSYNGVNKMIGASKCSTHSNSALSIISAGSYEVKKEYAFSNVRFQHAQFEDKLIMCNGVNTVQVYDGTADTIDDIDPALVGPSAPVGAAVFKNRVYYWDSNDSSLWYTDVLAYGGSCTEFDISTVSKYGGHIMTVEVLTLDGGMGPDDYLVIFMNTGEVLVYRGTSPSSIADWSIVGSYYVGELMGRRAIIKMGGDLFCVTTLDIINLGALLQGEEALTKRTKISGAMEEIAYLAGTFGFDAEIHPSKKLALFNIPDAGGTTFSQYVLNVVTGAWCKFTGWNASCWCRIEGELYFGLTGDATDITACGVYKAFDGNKDVVSTATDRTTENPIYSTLQTGWLNFGTAKNKTFHAIKPILRANTSVNLNVAIAVDFAAHGNLLFPPATEAEGTPWGSPWGSPWGPSGKSDVDWQIVEGYGRWVSALVKMSTKNGLAWASILWHIEVGMAM